MFLLPWSTGTGSEKVLPKAGKVSTGKARASPVIQIPLLNTAKRKRESDGIADQDSAPRPAKRRPDQTTHKDLRPSGIIDADKSQSRSSTGYTNGTCRELAAKPNSDTNVDFHPEESHSNMQLEAELAPQNQPNNIASSVYSKLDQKEEEAKHSTCADLSENSTNLTSLQETIESQFGLEILLKHRELRLIDQELAKCQVALEQLRRCHIIPYPATTSDPNIMLTVSTGTGPAYDARAQHPPPWGVTDGPYSRHYAQWLVPDAAFDETVPEDLPPRQAGKTLPGRASRDSKSQKTQAGTSSRAQRGSAREKLQALPHGYPEPKESKGPMIVKRSTDGRMVKLVCLDCRREDFNSAQGFINHCRIAHNRGFASHDAAAIACGEEVEMNSAGGVVGEAGGNQSSVGLVHPLIRSAHLTRANPTIATPKSKQKKPLPNSFGATQSQGSSDGASDLLNTPKPSANAFTGDDAAPSSFKPSPETPHLSALYARSGRGGDLNEMVTEAMKKPELETLFPDDFEDDDQEMEDAPEEIDGHHTLGTRGAVRGGGRLPARSGMSPAPMGRSPSNKGTGDHSRRKPGHLHTAMANSSYPRHYNPSALPAATPNYGHHSSHPDGSPADTLPTLNLSPNTIESHPAPSLVSDDGDYDNPHSDSEAPSSAVVSEDDDTLDVEVKDHEHHAMDVDEPSGSSTAELSMGKAHHGAPPPRRRAANGFGQTRVRKPQVGPRRKGGK